MAGFMRRRVLTVSLRDWIIAAIVTAAVFIVLQSVFAFGGWWYRDTPFPEGSFTLRALERTTTPEEPLNAELVIPALNIRVPIVFSKSRHEEDLQKDLERGAILYPGTALPGTTGNALVTAHSSDFFWKPGAYKTAFAKLGNLNIGDEEIVVIYQTEDGTADSIEFRVKETAIVSDTDTRLFAQGDTHELTLVTCWPIGTSWKRLMVKLERI